MFQLQLLTRKAARRGRGVRRGCRSFRYFLIIINGLLEFNRSVRRFFSRSWLRKPGTERKREADAETKGDAPPCATRMQNGI